MFDSREVRTLREENIALRAQLSDRESFIRSLLEMHARERKDLLDRVMSLAQPQALQRLREAPMEPRVLGQATPPIPNLPGREPSLRPTPRPRLVPPLGSDIEAAADLERGPGRS